MEAALSWILQLDNTALTLSVLLNVYLLRDIGQGRAKLVDALHQINTTLAVLMDRRS